MGRVYDALKRAESAQRPFKASQSSVGRNGNADNVAYFHPRNGNGHANGNGNGSASESADVFSMNRGQPAGEFTAVSTPDSDIIINEYPRMSESPTTIEELGAAFGRSGLGRGNNGQSL